MDDEIGPPYEVGYRILSGVIPLEQRRHSIQVSNDEYNAIVRIEGQACLLQHLLYYKWRYSNPDPDFQHLYDEVTRYCDMTSFLMNRFFHKGLDLVKLAPNAGALIHNMQTRYFNQVTDAESPIHWRIILWCLRYQQILQDESITIQEAFIRGWHLFMEPGGFTEEFWRLEAGVAFWHSMSSERQERFLENFKMNAEILSNLFSGSNLDLNDEEFEKREKDGMTTNFAELQTIPDIFHPAVKTPSQEHSECSICSEPVDTSPSGDHRPVETSCGHVFGYRCLRKWFEKQFTCPMCRYDFTSVPLHTPTSLDALRSCDRALAWLDPPIPHRYPLIGPTCVAKLSLLLGPANDIRENLLEEARATSNLMEEVEQLANTMKYIARERFSGVLRGDNELYREAAVYQMHLIARFEWLNFLYWCRPINRMALPSMPL